ncbi:DUF2690 domain-containing protein [Streptomyces sp. NPDC058459]|uniref:DUF2690 domain-containing protein n=1 Tax=Streptomyces sp. NPDC058459 TaxID=3346508 RepID=UPI0036563AFB
MAIVVMVTALIAAIMQADRIGLQTAAHREITEDTDPQDTGCDDGSIRTVTKSDVYGPHRLLLGEVRLRYSPECRAAWARFDAAPVMERLPGAEVSIQLTRPSDGKRLRYETPYLGLFVYGNMLRADKGCLRVKGSVSAPRPQKGSLSVLPEGTLTGSGTTRCALPE